MLKNNLSVHAPNWVVLLTAIFAGLSLAVSSGPAAASPWDRLGNYGVHLIMRHALAPGTGDPGSFKLGDCTTQRNLSDAGRAQATAIGLELKEMGIDVAQVFTSQWCRCRETARLLGLGTPADLPAINSFFRDRSSAAEQTAALRDLLADKDSPGPLMLVTHQVNITALTGLGVSSGEVFLIASDAEGRVEVLDRLIVQP